MRLGTSKARGTIHSSIDSSLASNSLTGANKNRCPLAEKNIPLKLQLVREPVAQKTHLAGQRKGEKMRTKTERTTTTTTKRTMAESSSVS